MTTSNGKTNRRVLGIVFLTVFLDLLGFGILIPIRPFYAESFGASPMMVTWLGGAYSLMQFLFVPFWGRLSDRIGRRPVILTSIVFGAAGYVLFGLAGSLGVLFASRMLAGFGNANLAAAQAVIADTTTPENRAKGMGMLGAAFGLGFLFGPAIGGITGQISPQTPAFIAAGLGALNWILAWRFLPETRVRRDDAPTVGRTPLRMELLRRAFTVENVATLLLLSLIATTAFSLMEQVLGLYIERTWVPEAIIPDGAVATGQHLAGHKRAALLTAYFLIVVGVAAVIVQGMLIGKLTRRFGEKRLALAGSFVLVVGLGAIPAIGPSQPFATMFIIAGLLAIGSGLTNPTLKQPPVSLCRCRRAGRRARARPEHVGAGAGDRAGSRWRAVRAQHRDPVQRRRVHDVHRLRTRAAHPGARRVDRIASFRARTPASFRSGLVLAVNNRVPKFVSELSGTFSEPCTLR